MNPRITPARPTRRHLPGVEGLEGRELLSATPIPYPSGVIPPVGNLTAAPSFAGATTPKENLGPLQPDIGLVPLFRALAYPTTVTTTNPDRTTTTLPNPQPTAGEVARQYFTAEFTGTYTVTPGHFAGQAATVKIVTKAVRSNQFLHGKAQVVIATATDVGGAFSPAARFYGTAALLPQNVLYSGETVVLDLEGNSSTNPNPSLLAYNAQGLPSHMAWVPDPASGTGYTGATGFGQGYGYMDAVYHPDRHPQKGTTSSGKVTVLFQGLINTAGVLSYNDPGTQ